MSFDERYAEYLGMIEPALKEYFGGKKGLPFDGLLESMDYSLTAGGKRLRPALVLEFCRVCGGDIGAALPVACAVEMLHTYSLIHDDLPCMDNDDLRRGKPTNHRVYGECTAVLAGDALQAEAFGTILRSELPAERRARCAEHLANAAGVDGICGGQFMDMLTEHPEDEAWQADLATAWTARHGAEGAGPGIGFIGHMDTVFPVGTARRRPFTVDLQADRVYGPGVADMKGGLVAMLFAARTLAVWKRVKYSMG